MRLSWVLQLYNRINFISGVFIKRFRLCKKCPLPPFFQGCHVLKQSNEEAQRGVVETLSGVQDYLESTEILVVRGKREVVGNEDGTVEGGPNGFFDIQ